MRVRRSLHHRIAFGYALFLALILIGFSVAILEISDRQGERLIDHIMGQEMDYLVDQYRVNSQVLPPRTQNLYGYIVRVQSDKANVPKILHGLLPGVHEVYVGDSELHVNVRDYSGVRFYLTYDVSQHEELEEQFKKQVYIAIVFGILLAIWLGYYLAGLLLKQVTDLAQRVSRLQPGEQQVGLAEKYGDEEVVRLATAFDDYQRKMSDMILREKQFTSDVSHELRNPLTSIRTSCELLAQDTGMSPQSLERLERTMKAIDRMTGLVDALLRLVRAEHRDVDETLPLAQALDDAVDPMRELLRQKGISLETEFDQKISVKVNRQALLLILSNLLKNAIDHTDGGKIHVSYRKGRLCIKDTGSGINKEEMPYIFERFYRGNSETAHSGFGLGLAIVKRICDEYDWKISVDSGPGTGSEFCIDFHYSK